jgi:protease II
MRRSRLHTAPYKVFVLDGKTLEWTLVGRTIRRSTCRRSFPNASTFLRGMARKSPIFIVHRKDLQRNGANATLLHGYGGFNHSAAPF